MRTYLKLISLAILGCTLSNQAPLNLAIPTVTISQGRVIGSVGEDGNLEFYGIPYAQSPTGVNRFKAPQPASPFPDEQYVANRRNIKCVHRFGMRFEGIEECLVVDVHTPPIEQNSKLPVMVWIKGREFDRDNDHEKSFRTILGKEVVVVRMNFRESIFGFLCLGTETAPGNAGLKDIIQGLKWVRENIAAFGGNPDDVTIFGHGSGAAMVDLVTLSPLADGLVHKAISQSGSALAPWAVSRDNLNSAVQVAKALGHNFETADDLSEIFARTSITALIAVINDIEQTDNALVFAPCVERQLPDEEPFMLNTPTEIIASGKFLRIPFMIGFVEKEGTIRAEEVENAEFMQEIQDSFQNFLPADLEFETEEKRTEVAQSIRNFYFQDTDIPNNIPRFIDYQGDTMITISAIREARLRTTSSNSGPVYLYQFSYQGDLGKPLVGPLAVDGAAHSEELGYLFYETPLILETNDIREKDIQVADILVDRWTNFAKTGDPTGEDDAIEWTPFTNENPSFLRILDTMEGSPSPVNDILTNPRGQDVEFWDNIYKEHFLDAQSKWIPTRRDDDDDDDDENDDDNNNESGENGDSEEPTTAGPPPGESGDTTETPPTTPAPNAGSASAAVGFTILIVSAFMLLENIHSAQILS